MQFDVYDNTCKFIESRSFTLSNSEVRLISTMLLNSDDSYQGSLVGVKGKGFIRLGYEKIDGQRIVIEMIDNKAAVKWQADSKAESKKSFEAIVSLYTNEKVFISALSTREKLLSKDVKYFTLFINPDNGEEYFRLANASNGNQLSPLGASFDENSQTYFVYGQYFLPEDNLAKDDSRGIYIMEVDLTGKIYNESYIEWEGEVYNAIVRKSQGEIKKNTKMFVHTVLRPLDGKVFVIAEQYNKAVSGLGVASAVLAGGNSGTSVMKVEITNLVSIELDNNLKYKDVSVYKKNKSNIQLPQGWGMIDANKLGYMMSLYGNFDYAFSSTSADKKTFISTYVDYDKNKDAGSNYTIGCIGYTKEQKLKFDKVLLKSKPYAFKVYQAKPGYIAIYEYFKKEKKATLRLEKLNF